MLRRVLASVFFAVLVSVTAAVAQAPPLLIGTPFSRTVFLSLDAVQAQVDATLVHEAASRVLIAAALAQAPPPLLKSTPIPRR